MEDPLPSGISVLKPAASKGALLSKYTFSGYPRWYYPYSVELEDFMVPVPLYLPFKYALSGLVKAYENATEFVWLRERVETTWGFALATVTSDAGGSTLSREIYTQAQDGTRSLLLSPDSITGPAVVEETYSITFIPPVTRIIVNLFIDGIYDENAIGFTGLKGYFEYIINLPPVP